MHHFLDTADDVIALVVAERLTGGDLDAIMDRLQPALDRHGTVHVFVETRAIDGIDIAGLGAHVARAMPLLGRLRQFGRVAVVADQPWIRAGTRIESALLPFVGYRVFQPAGRDQALAWVTGAAAG